MDAQAKISVIVPIYNTEQYLERCITSIVQQTYPNLEILLIDDGSTDQSPAICDAWGARDSRIQVIHKENGGVSTARNLGLDLCQGEYVTFVDSDDVLHFSMLEILLKQLESCQADISVCNFYRVKNIKRIKQHNINIDNLSSQIFENKAVFNLLFSNQIPLVMVPWGKLYRADLIKQFRFDARYKICEDEKLIHYLLYKTRRIVYCKEKLYLYVYRKNSLTAGKFNIDHLEILNAKHDRWLFCKQYISDFEQLSLDRYLRCLAANYVYLKKTKNNKDILRNILNEFNNKILICSNVPSFLKLFQHSKFLFSCGMSLRNLIKRCK